MCSAGMVKRILVKAPLYRENGRRACSPLTVQDKDDFVQ